MVELAKPYDYEGALRFPLIPYARQTAWRYMFDWAVAGEALHCVPGELVLEFGAGPSYASELLNRLGYYTVALDLNPEILAFAQKRLTIDQRLDPGRANFVAGDGQHLPFADGTFDGVICLNAFHHMPDYVAALSEIRRILRPSGRAAFSEPGSRHAESPEAKAATRQFGVVEKSVVLDEIYQIALSVGFERMILKPYVYPGLVELDYRELGAYRRNRSAAQFTRRDEIAEFVQHTHPIFVLTVPGERPITSVRPGLLRAEIRVSEPPATVHPGQEILIQALVHNMGDTLWLGTPREFGGYVAFGMKLCRPDGRLLSAIEEHTCIGQDVPPGGTVSVRSRIQLPETLTPGIYLLRLDMVDEQVGWFEEFGSPVIEHWLHVTDETNNGSLESNHRSQISELRLSAHAGRKRVEGPMSFESKDMEQIGRVQETTSLEEAWLLELQRRLYEEWRIEERPFHSNVPLIGPLIAAFRSAWNSVAAKWYVRHLFEQQQAYNQLTRQLLIELIRTTQTLTLADRRQGRLLGDRELSIAALAEQVARLETMLWEMDDRLSALEGADSEATEATRQ